MTSTYLAMRLEQYTEMYPVSAIIEQTATAIPVREGGEVEADIIGKLPAADIAGTTGSAGITRSVSGSVISGKVSHWLRPPLSLSAY